MFDRDSLTRKMRALGIELSDRQAGQFETYYEMMIEKNKVMNLTAITDPEEVIEKHFVDSLAMAAYTDLTKIGSCIDVGTGGGFPGVPLKIVYPHLQMTLMDSLNKRLVFLEDVIRELGLSDTVTCHARAEDLGHQKTYREHYDLCTSRAVANLSTLSEYCLPLVRQGGSFISYKAGQAEAEIEGAREAVRILGGRIDHIYSYQIPGTDYDRTLIEIRKIKGTPGKYPRKAGTPSREPLK